MQELIQKVVSQVGISEDQVKQTLGVISQFIKEKFPAAGGMIDQLLSSGGSTQTGDSSGAGDSGGINLGGFKI